MAADEYVSVSSLTAAEQAETARETREMKDTPEAELEELARIYIGPGLDQGLAWQVALQLTEKDALGTHARDALDMPETMTADSIQVTFAVGAVIPIIIGASVGGAGIVKGAIRVAFWAALAMAVTAAVDMLFGVTGG